MVWLRDGSLSMAGGNVTVSHISRCDLHFVVQTNLQDTVSLFVGEFARTGSSDVAPEISLRLIY